LELSAPGNALIERTADTARSSRGEYRLVGEAVTGTRTSHRRTEPARATTRTAKIVTIVAEIGTLPGRVVQTMFDVQPATASRILSDLVDRGILVKTSTASRGDPR